MATEIILAHFLSYRDVLFVRWKCEGEVREHVQARGRCARPNQTSVCKCTLSNDFVHEPTNDWKLGF